MSNSLNTPVVLIGYWRFDLPVRRTSDYGTAICLGVILYVEGIVALTLFNLVLIGYWRFDLPLRRTTDYGTAICLGVILYVASVSRAFLLLRCSILSLLQLAYVG